MDSEIQTSDGSGDEPGRKSKRAQPVETVVVKIIQRQGKAVLVEWIDNGKYRRATVPASKLAGNDCPADVLEASPAYGVDWAAKFGLPGSEILANELRRQGIWTKEDFMRGRATVNAVMMRVFVNPLVDELVKEL